MTNNTRIPDDSTSQTGKGGAGESGGGAYPNPHTGKEKRGGKRKDFEGGQSENRYFGPEDAQANSAKGAARQAIADHTDDTDHSAT